jgi:hypothetical protein
VHLEQFCIVRSQRAPGRLSAMGFHGSRTVVAWISFAALEASLRRTVDGHEDATLVTQSNLDLFERITASKYERGDYVPHEQAGPNVDLVVVTGQDIAASGERVREPTRVAVTWSPDGRFGRRNCARDSQGVG